MTRVQGNDSRWDAWMKQASSGTIPQPQINTSPIKGQPDRSSKGQPDSSSKAAASRLKRRSGRSGADGLFDKLASAFKRRGCLPETYLRSLEGKAALRQLGQLSDGAAARQLRRRGLGDKQIDKLRQDLYVHLQRQVGRTINDSIKDARTVVARMVRDAGVRRGFSGYLAGLKGAGARAEALEGLGVEARTAAALARTPRCPDAKLLGALKTADADLQRLWTQATMTKLDPIRAAGTFELFGKLADKVRRDLGLPAGNGSFGSKALDAGIKAAHRSRAKEATYGKIASIAASVIATVVTGGSYGVAAALALGATSSTTTAVVSGLPGLAKARHKRKLAEAGEALGLADKGAAARARGAERSTRIQYGAGVGASALTGTIGSGAASAIPNAAAGGLAAPAASALGAGAAETANQVALPKIVK